MFPFLARRKPRADHRFKVQIRSISHSLKEILPSKPFSSKYLYMYGDDNIDYPCKRRLCLSLLLHRISFFLFFPSQQKACAHAKPAGVPPIFELADRTIFTRDKCTRVAQNSPQRRIIIGVITAVFHRYSFSSVFIRSGYHPLSLFLSSTTLNVNASRKYIRFSNIFPIPRIDFVFFFSPPLPSGREQQTRAYLLLPRLKSIFAITRPVHGNSDSTPVFT